VSHDGGKTWQARTMNTQDYAIAALPQVAAGRPGEVVLAWYGSRSESTNEVATYVARSTDGGAIFAIGPASPTIHFGILCASTAPECADPNGNDLRDNFGLVIHPGTHKVTVAYTSDWPEGDRPHDFIGYATES
jgi:hypothetical protein